MKKASMRALFSVFICVFEKNVFSSPRSLYASIYARGRPKNIEFHST